MVSNFLILKPKVVFFFLPIWVVFFFCVLVSRQKIGCFLAKIHHKKGFSGNTHIFFYFLFKVFSETRTKNGGIHVFFGVRTWNLWWYSFKPGDFWWSWRPYTWLGPRPGAEQRAKQPAGRNAQKNIEKRAPLRVSGPARCKASNSTKNPRFQWNHHRFQVLTPKNTWNRHFWSEFHWNRKEKKMWGFPLEPVLPTVYALRHKTKFLPYPYPYPVFENFPYPFRLRGENLQCKPVPALSPFP